MKKRDDETSAHCEGCVYEYNTNECCEGCNYGSQKTIEYNLGDMKLAAWGVKRATRTMKRATRAMKRQRKLLRKALYPLACLETACKARQPFVKNRVGAEMLEELIESIKDELR